MCAQLFSPRQKAQLDVYGVWGVLRGQLLTDDSFVFNRVLTRLKTSIANLAPADEADEAALAAAKARSFPPCCLSLSTVLWAALRAGEFCSECFARVSPEVYMPRTRVCS